MKKSASLKSILCLLIVFPIIVNAQSNFDLKAYELFLESNQNLTYDQFVNQHPLDQKYFTGEGTEDILGTTYLDSVIIKYELTEGEMELLKKNHFVVSERMSYPSFGQAYASIFHNDLPVFVSTDAILHALHSSYDRILVSVENGILIPNLYEVLRKMYIAIPELKLKYQAFSELDSSINDVDLYTSIAYSLLSDTLHLPYYEKQEKFNKVMNAISAEQMIEMLLFSTAYRKLDFSQFKVRSHYTESEQLSHYFKAMMWLGRIDFLLTNTKNDEDIPRMNQSAFMLNELLDISEARSILEKNDEIITFFVGEDDNISPKEYDALIDSMEITSADQLLDSIVLDTLMGRMLVNNQYGQRIMSNIIIVDPFSAEPDPLPVSFRLIGQKFIIDSYVFSNVVYDRIIFQKQKIHRMMPKTFDALFALGNNDALPFLQNELEQYHYSSQLNAMRYLIDHYDDSFWENSLYNLWLNSIRRLNPKQDTTGFPGFMKTSAWRQEKMNTQLASWSQLRHDNLLYAKQSYTGGEICSFPHSFVEPYPEFYKAIGDFAENANLFFAEVPENNWQMTSVNSYFTRIKEVMHTLEEIAEKQLNNEAISEEEDNFLQNMLITGYAECGAPPYRGWFMELFYNQDKALEQDYLIADVHTQPTDESGALVGNILHVATGKVNLGVFLAKSNKTGRTVAFTGPVFSYYEKITDNFLRMTDKIWTDSVSNNLVPQRPGWTNIYLANNNGALKESLAELPYKYGKFTSISEPEISSGLQLSFFPNPVNEEFVITYTVDQAAWVTIKIFDISGRELETIVQRRVTTNSSFQKELNASYLEKGIYLIEMATDSDRITKRIILR